MRTIDTIDIAAAPAAVYQAAAEIERWPAWLAHYRWVTVLGAEAGGRRVAMAARRGWIPVQWEAIQRCDPAQMCIFYRHLRGPTTGMAVIWALTPTAIGTHVTLTHDLTLETPLVRSWLGTMIVGHGFVHAIARQTLSGLKAVLEKESTCAVPSSPALDPSRPAASAPPPSGRG